MAALVTRQALASAMRHQTEGRLPEAALLCHAILHAEPNHADAMNLLAVVLCKSGRISQGIDVLKRALALRPDDAPTLDRLGDALYVQRDLDGAIAAYQQALGRAPGAAALWCKLGIAFQDQGKADAAEAAYRRAIAINPSAPRPHFNLGLVLRRAGRLDEAAAAYGRAISLKPDYPEAFLNLGNVLMDKGRADLAVRAYRQAIGLGPDHTEQEFDRVPSCDRRCEAGVHSNEAGAADQPAFRSSRFYGQAYTNLGIGLKKQGKLEAAIAAHRRAIALQPDYAEAHNNLGVVLQDLGRFDEAIAAHRQAVLLKPDFGTAHSNLGVALKAQGSIDAAIAAHRCAIAAEPDHPKIHFNYANVLLMAGEFAEGFREYEWRWKGGVPALRDRNFGRPQWQGDDLRGRTLLLHAEQGFGDTLQFIRFAAELAGRDGTVALEVPRPLLELMRSASGIDAVVAVGDPLPAFDVHLPLMSLPHMLQSRVDGIPARIPYLLPDPSRRIAWRDRLGRDDALKVGVVWAGNPRHTHDHQRSLSAKALLPQLDMAGVRLFSLQKEPRPGDAGTLAALGGEVTDLAPLLHDFADTAAAVAALDLVIAVDTSIVHLGGALGRPVWTLLPFALDWRWMLDREDSPWYPTMRLFRQPRPGDWDSVIARVQIALTRLAARAVADRGDRAGTPHHAPGPQRRAAEDLPRLRSA